jgi:hypothetical protein
LHPTGRELQVRSGQGRGAFDHGDKHRGDAP